VTATEEQEMHELALQLANLTFGSGWEAMRYMAIAQVMEKLAEYCAVRCKKCEGSK
jgi:hypothetical protein